jgi:Uma2 family endonuclease
MGMPALPSTGWTVEMLEALPDDGQRYEIVDGELLVTPAPSVAHQRAVGSLYRRLYAYLAGSADAEVILSPADVRSGTRTSVQPDLLVMRRPVQGGPRDWPDLETLLLAVEVTSPSTARADRTVKRRLYQSRGVAEYWIVDLDARIVERWRPGDERPEIVEQPLEWRSVGRDGTLVIDLEELFREAEGPAGTR